MDLPLSGGCRCGALRFEIAARPLLSVACHCRGCQRMSGGPYSLSLAIPPDAFQVTSGEDVAGGADHGFGHRFCGACLSWVFTRLAVIGIVNVRTTMLDDPGPWPPFAETCTDERLPWVATPARHGFPAFPPEEVWPGLMAEFARDRLPFTKC
jgi:hypothetical protein